LFKVGCTVSSREDLRKGLWSTKTNYLTTN